MYHAILALLISSRVLGFISLVEARAAFQDVMDNIHVAGQVVLNEKPFCGTTDQEPLAPTNSDAQASSEPPYWLDQQDHTSSSRGFAPFLGTYYTYPVYRNVRSYGATGDGSTDDTDALQNATNDDGQGGNRYKNEVTTRPALVFVPGGTYRLTKQLDMRLNTILVGDPNDMPVFKASSDFQGQTMINGDDYATHGTYGTTNFFIAIKNIVIDTTRPMLKFHDSSNDGGDRNNQITIENLSFSGNNPVAIGSDGAVKLASSANIDTWIWGNVNPGTYQTGKTVTTNRSPGLLSNGKYFTMSQPTYKDYTGDQVQNVKAVSGHTVKGDGKTDDSASLNAILAQNAADGKLSYFPYGVYIVKSTLYVPPGTRIVGEAWSVISGTGSAFGDRNNPAPVIKVGNPGETGIAQISDMRFTVADIAPGAIILQVNMAGPNPGDVGFWNTHVTVGGAADTKVNVACDDPNTADCLAAFALVHLTSTSSTYIENMWGWTADHSLERGKGQNIATGRGLLVEATKPTWLTGTGFEHNTLYNYNLHNAQNIYAGLQQTETAYWQGVGSPQNAPGPWTADSRFGDPDFSWCAAGDVPCRMGLAQNVDGGSNLYLYGAAFWTFFNGHTPCGANCITNQARVTGNPTNLYWYGIATKSADVMVLDGKDNPDQHHNPGGWTPGGVIAAYLRFMGN
ncbi:MAG: hypothetical protein LQ338_004215 [Usnochroma carphineum]|nr:MAG: hypothetical protein LQ338_004215 [Usnochroma carphineum]